MQALKIALRAFCAVWCYFCALCPYVARRLLLCCCGSLCGSCCNSSRGGASSGCAAVRGVSSICRRAAFRGSLQPLVSVRPAAMIAARTLCGVSPGWRAVSAAGVAGVLLRGRGPRGAWFLERGEDCCEGSEAGTQKNRGYFEKVSGLNFPADFRGLP